MDVNKEVPLLTTFINLIPYLIVLIALIFIELDFKNKILFGIILITPMLHRDIKDGSFKKMSGRE